MDGTILDTLDDLTNSMNHILSAHGMAQRTKDEVRNFVGNGIRKLCERAVPAGTDVDTVDEVYRDFHAYYPLHCAENTRAYPGIPEAIASLRQIGCRTAVVSNKADGAVKILSKQYFDGLFDVSVGEKPGRARKPAPDEVLAAMEALGADKRETVYIGDSDVDAATAQNSGLDCILVSWGFRGRELLETLPHIFIADNANQLADYLIENK